SSANSSGPGTVQYNVQSNSGPQRTGTMTIAGQTFTVTQANGCSYSIFPTSQGFSASGGSGSVSVTTSSGCSWTASTATPWININSGSSGSGSGSVNYSVQFNNT